MITYSIKYQKTAVLSLLVLVYITEQAADVQEKSTIEDDLKKTLFIKDIPIDVSAEMFIKFVEHAGEVKIHDQTGRHLAEMHIDKSQERKEGIVTFETRRSDAEKILKGMRIGGKYISVRKVSDELDKVDKSQLPKQKSVHYNEAWNYWNMKVVSYHLLNEEHRHGKGGRGGKGGQSIFGFRGEDGRPGEDGYC